MASSIGARPSRAALTMLGTVLGVASFVTVLGLTGSANAQIAETFNAQSAREVTVERVDVPDESGAGASRPFTRAGLRRLRTLPGVDAVGIRVEWASGARVSTRVPTGTAVEAVTNVIAVDPGYWQASAPQALHGRTTQRQGIGARLAVLGAGVAEALGWDHRTWPRFVYLDGVQMTVAGVVGANDRDPTSPGNVYLDDETAARVLGPRRAQSPPQLLVSVQIGAAAAVADRAALALDPTHPEHYDVAPVSTPTKVRDRVSESLRSLFLGLAAVSLFVGALGIANTTLVSVLARRSEIGLRRAMGASRSHVVVQVLGESALLGALGGLLGGLIGLGATVGVALANEWTAVLAGWVVPAGPAIGALTGLVAGLHPASRAARMEPAEALRHS